MIDSSNSIDGAKHAMECFARMVKAILGDDALAERKLVVGNPRATLNADKSEIWRSGILKSWSIHN